MDKATELEAALALLQPRPLLLLSTLEVEREPHRAVVTVLAPSRAAQKLARLVAPKRVAEGSARHDTRVRARARQRPVGWREETILDFGHLAPRVLVHEVEAQKKKTTKTQTHRGRCVG